VLTLIAIASNPLPINESLGRNKMAYTYLKAEVKAISTAELTALKNAYIEAEKNNQLWIMQAIKKVFDDIDIGVVKIFSYN
tara:strand:- start:1267 stop:1509 length:243 start_codon:yes stop_codon:yes gene_type:complete